MEPTDDLAGEHPAGETDVGVTEPGLVAALETETGTGTADDEIAPAPWWGPAAIAAFVGLVVCTNFANVLWARWVNDHPVLLLALSSRQRYLVATVSAGIAVFPYVVVATIRIAAAFTVCHLIGRAYRGRVLRLFTRYLGLTPEAIDAYYRGLDRAEIALIPLFVGSNIVAVLTGIRGTRPGRLYPLLAIGIAGRLALMWWLAKVFETPINRFLNWVDRYDKWVILVSLLLVIAVNVRNFRRGAEQ